MTEQGRGEGGPVRRTSKPNAQLISKRSERAWIAAVVVGITYDDDTPAESELSPTCP